MNIDDGTYSLFLMRWIATVTNIYHLNHVWPLTSLAVEVFCLASPSTVIRMSSLTGSSEERKAGERWRDGRINSSIIQQVSKITRTLISLNIHLPSTERPKCCILPSRQWCSGLGHCISVLEMSLQTLVQFQAVSQPSVIGSPIGWRTIGSAALGFDQG